MKTKDEILAIINEAQNGLRLRLNNGLLPAEVNGADIVIDEIKQRILEEI